MPPNVTYKTPDMVKMEFKGRGWVSQSGDLYFNGNGGTTHPHLHLKIEGRGTVSTRNGDVRAAVKMLAWSDGNQHGGGGGRTMIRVGPRNFVQLGASTTAQNEEFLFNKVATFAGEVATVMKDAGTNQDIKEELGWIWTYFQGR